MTAKGLIALTLAAALVAGFALPTGHEHQPKPVALVQTLDLDS